MLLCFELAQMRPKFAPEKIHVLLLKFDINGYLCLI